MGWQRFLKCAEITWHELMYVYKDDEPLTVDEYRTVQKQSASWRKCPCPRAARQAGVEAVQNLLVLSYEN